MAYKLGNRSVQKLEGVDDRMQAVVRAAIGQSKQDFSVICGLRTIEEQRALVAKGASKTMKSKHLDGVAVDLMERRMVRHCLVYPASIGVYSRH